MKTILLTKGFFAQVDNDIYPYLMRWKWHYNSGYAERKEYRDGKQIHILMHRVILDTPKGKLTDHKNGDTLDNWKENLRIVTHSTNAMNMKKHRGKSVYKGVTKEGNIWRTTIWKDNKCAFRITMPNERWAAMAYDLNAQALFGEYGNLNFPNALIKVKAADELPE